MGSAQVTIVGTSLSTLTSGIGHFLFPNVPAGTHVVRAFAPGLGAAEVGNVVVQSSATRFVSVGAGARPGSWNVIPDSLLLGGAPARDLILYVDSLGVIPTPGDSAHARLVRDSVAARGLTLASDAGGVMVFGIATSSRWDTLAARDSVFRLAYALRRDLPSLVKQAGPVVRYRAAGAPSVATDEVVVRFDTALTVAQVQTLSSGLGARIVNRNPFVRNEFLIQALDRDGIALSNAFWVVAGPPRVLSAYPNLRVRASRTAGPGGEPLSGDQWHLKRVNVEPAWPLATQSVVVAVIESDGFEDQHPDLKGRLWQSNDGAGDGDGDGLAAETAGWNFADCSSAATGAGVVEAAPGAGIVPATCGEPGLSTASVKPVHGTAVAGLVAADRNGVGVVGVCPTCRLMLIVVDANDPYSQRLGFLYAEQHGAQVVNLSWRLRVSLDDVDPAYVTTVTRIASERVVVVSIGNDERDFCTGSEAGFQAVPNAVVVGASNQRDKRIRSGFGDCLSVLAPGGRGGSLLGVTTTDMTGAAGINAEWDPLCATGEFGPGDVPHREYTHCFGGTSAAAPIVSGVVGLVLAVAPALTGPQVKRVLTETADKIQRGSAQYDGTGRSGTHGYGRVNACAAVLQAAGDPEWLEKCGDATPGYCRFWLLLLIALLAAAVVFFVARQHPIGWRLVVSVAVGGLVLIVLLLLCRLLT